MNKQHKHYYELSIKNDPSLHNLKKLLPQIQKEMSQYRKNELEIPIRLESVRQIVSKLIRQLKRYPDTRPIPF